MTLRSWWLFVAMTFVVSATPGPNMLFVMGLVLCLCRERQTAVGLPAARHRHARL